MELVFSVIGIIVPGVLVLGKRGPKGGMIGPARLGLTRDCWSLTD
jgi:hypothetical protein